MIKLLIADSHPIIGEGFKVLFESSEDVEVVGVVHDGESIFDFLGKNKVDIVMSEIDLPKLNGITALRRMKSEFPEVKSLIFSIHPEEVYAVSAIKAGTSGYLSKTSDIISIKEAISKISQGQIYLSNSLAQHLAFGGRFQKSGAFYKKLSLREIEVLKLISSGKKNKHIAKELDINEKTVSTYKARLMKKMRVDNIVDLINQTKGLDL